MVVESSLPCSEEPSGRLGMSTIIGLYLQWMGMMAVEVYNIAENAFGIYVNFNLGVSFPLYL